MRIPASDQLKWRQQQTMIAGDRRRRAPEPRRPVAKGPGPDPVSERMEQVLAYVRNFLAFTTAAGRKRRAVVEECESPAKMRKTNATSTPGEREVSSSFKRRPSLSLPKPNLDQRPSWTLKDISPIVLDEDDDVIAVKPTSTPNASMRTPNGNVDDDEVVFVKSMVDRKALAKQKGLEYIRPAILDLNVRPRNGNKLNDVQKVQNGLRKSVFEGVKEKKDSPSISGSDYSFRLDERKRYSELISSSKFKPPGQLRYADLFKLYGEGCSGRGKQTVDLSSSSSKERQSSLRKSTQFVDLTTSDVPPKDQKRRNTLETIENVLKQFDGVAAAKAPKAELPTPPEPEPDFPTVKFNSLAAVRHPSDPDHNDWMQNVIERHQAVILQRQREIDEVTESLGRLAQVNADIRDRRQHARLDRCLRVRNAFVAEHESRAASEDAFRPLTPAQNAAVDDAFARGRPSTEVLVSKFNMRITRADLGTLDGLNWLNDEVINFYMNLIIERGKSNRFPSAYAMNTFFYPKVSASGQSSVKRWTRKVDVFSYDLIAVPIHLGVHWCMAVVDLRKRTIAYYDSMGNPNNSCLSTLRQYLKDEHLDKKQTELDVSDWRLYNVHDIPQQMNGSDCGMFSITFAEFLTRDARITFGQENMPYLRRKVAAEILEAKLFVS